MEFENTTKAVQFFQEALSLCQEVENKLHKSPLRLSGNEFVILAALERLGGSKDAEGKRIREEVEISASVFTRILVRLSRKGLVKIKKDTADRRQLNLKITNKGFQIAIKAETVIAAITSEHHSAFSELVR